MDEAPLISIVGVCGSGKSTLAAALRQRGYNARSLAQEHSSTEHLWMLRKPAVLIALDCCYEECNRRKPGLSREKWQAQRLKLVDAFAHAHIVIRTDQAGPDETVALAVAGIRKIMGVSTDGAVGRISSSDSFNGEKASGGGSVHSGCERTHGSNRVH